MKNDRLKLVIFDKDGLMLDTERPVFVIWREVFSEWGLEPLTEELYGKFIGLGRQDNITQLNRIFPDIDGDALFSACGARTRRFLAENPIRVMTGLIQLLDFLDAKKLQKAVATSSRRENAEMTLKKCGVFDRVDIVISGDMVEKSKPAPDIFQKAAAVMGFCPSECLILEDSPAGIIAAHAAGIPVIAVPDMVEPPPEILALCERRCESLSEVIPYISEHIR